MDANKYFCTLHAGSKNTQYYTTAIYCDGKLVKKKVCP